MKSNSLIIKTITCHNVYNHGASLQEFALLHYLKSLGHDAKAIKYNPKYLSNHYNFFAISNPKWEKNILTKILYLTLKFPLRLLSLRRKYNFDKFSKKHIPTTQSNYTSNNELKNNIPKADVYICGSDQIWNSFFQNGKDPSFYLDFVPKNKLKISYAASFATETIEDEIKPFVKNKVENIDYISVRETSGLTILKELGINNAIHVLDPVFLLNKEFWLKLTKPSNIKQPYVFVYDADNNPSIKKMAEQMAKDNDWIIVSVSQQISYADKNLSHKGPDIFLDLINNAKFVISNSFHAVAFSIIFQKQFVVFNRGESINTRMKDMVASLNIPKTLLPYNYNKKYNNNNNNNNYKEVYPILEKSIHNSKEFLIHNLAKVKK